MSSANRLLLAHSLAIIFLFSGYEQITSEVSTTKLTTTTKRNANSNRQPATTRNWSVELASVTTLPPPDKLFEAISSTLEQNQHQQRASNSNHQQQESLFDDSPLTDLNSINQVAWNFTDGKNWTPTNVSPIPTQTEPIYNFGGAFDGEQSAKPAFDTYRGAISPPILDAPKQRPYITIEALSKYLLNRTPAEPRSASLPRHTPISQDILRRALAIQDALPELQPTTANADSSLATSRAKRIIGLKNGSNQLKSLLNQPDFKLVANNPPVIMLKSSSSVTQRHDHGTERDRSTADLVGSDYLSPLAHQKQFSVAYEPSNRNYFQLSAPPPAGGGRSFKLDSDHHDHLTLGSSSILQQPLDSQVFAPSFRHHSTMPAIYVTSAYPLGSPSHKSLARHAHDKSSLIHPILVGVLAALVSFLILSNLFLSIPLLAMTLFQLFNGASTMMMMLPNGNQNMMPSNNNQQNPSAPTNNQPMTNGRRRRRRDLWPDEREEAILKAIRAPAVVSLFQ